MTSDKNKAIWWVICVYFWITDNYTPSPAEAEFDGLTTGFETIPLCP
jgi:hypothetical protein